MDPIIDIEDLKVISGYVFLADAVLLVAFGLVGGLLIPQLTGTFHRGFFCDDQSIQYMYRNDTVTPAELLLYSLSVTLATITATEYYRAKKIRRIPIPQYRLGNTSVDYVIVRVMTYIGYSMIGLMCVFVLTNVTKSCVGRLRPHFLDVCRPVNITCQKSEFYNNYTCTGDAARVEEARKSFFSGHSSIAMYASTFTAIVTGVINLRPIRVMEQRKTLLSRPFVLTCRPVIFANLIRTWLLFYNLYLLARMPRYSTGQVLVPISQTALLAAGLLISLSRINDNKHHWSDVVVGIFVGVSVAIYTCFVWAGMFTRQHEEVLPIRKQYMDYTEGTAADNGLEYSNQDNASTRRNNHREP